MSHVNRCLLMRITHRYPFFVFISIWSKAIDKKRLLTSADLTRDRWQNVKKLTQVHPEQPQLLWPWLNQIDVMSSTGMSMSIFSHCLTYNGEVIKWHNLRSLTSNIWDIHVVDIGGLVTICEFQVTLSFTVTWAGRQTCWKGWKWSHLTRLGDLTLDDLELQFLHIIRNRYGNRYAKFGGAARGSCFTIHEKPDGAAIAPHPCLCED